MATASTSTGEQMYVYCIVLPFTCTAVRTDLEDTLTVSAGRRRPVPRQPPPESFVVRVGITNDPAELLCGVFGVFRELGETKPLLGWLSRNDDPETAVAKAKSINNVIFIEKVQNPGNVDQDIRATLHMCDPSLMKSFTDSFAASIPEEKKSCLDVLNIPEWIVMNIELAFMLREKFRDDGIFRPGLLQKSPPSGVQLTRVMNDICKPVCTGTSIRALTRRGIVIGGARPLLVILFDGTKFSFGL